MLLASIRHCKFQDWRQLFHTGLSSPSHLEIEISLNFVPSGRECIGALVSRSDCEVADRKNFVCAMFVRCVLTELLSAGGYFKSFLSMSLLTYVYMLKCVACVGFEIQPSHSVLLTCRFTSMYKWAWYAKIRSPSQITSAATSLLYPRDSDVYVNVLSSLDRWTWTPCWN